jgi:formaldehyde-activating enzyme involved in methanogenesis
MTVLLMLVVEKDDNMLEVHDRSSRLVGIIHKDFALHVTAEEIESMPCQGADANMCKEAKKKLITVVKAVRSKLLQRQRATDKFIVVSIKLPWTLLQKIDRYAVDHKITRSEAIRMAMEEFLKNQLEDETPSASFKKIKL